MNPNSISTDVKSLVEQTFNDLELDVEPKSKARSKYARHVQPVDYAILQQKAFKQFDLIIDAERNLEKVMKKSAQIHCGKDRLTPRSTKKFNYSTIDKTTVPSKKEHRSKFNSTK